ncbi:MAG: PSD1 and planctomycete cytochrome C domain-containing protein [Planctomycetia bacterium]|nr:PSD1 and planctomycete cytochrome C domain-containing protein [Planctomycetia bacterium]
MPCSARLANNCVRLLLGLVGGGIVAATPAWADLPPEQLAFFESKIRPVLLQHCYECHSAEALKGGRLKAELLLDSRAGMAKGGESGPAVVAGKKEESLLLAALKYDGYEMPPSGKLPDEVIGDFEKWIEMGAPDPRDEPLADAGPREIDVAAGRNHWSYRRLAAVSPPAVANMAWVRNDVDRFILAKQEAAGITPNAEAGKEKLLRRVTFGLTGLPPTPGERQLFMADTSPAAYEKLVDRLLASPRYGERWGRHWLDAVRFAESGGYEFDGDRPGAHHYRDFVIRAFNDDMPYDRFLQLQIAGDLIDPASYDAISATGFFVAGPYPGQITMKTAEPIRYDQLDDMVQALGSGVLGMTIGCARCHDHKYDAISHRDYYAMIACLGNTVHTTVALDPNPEATKLARAEWEAMRAPVVAVLDRFRTGEFPARLEKWLASDIAAQAPAPWLLLDPDTLTAARATLTADAEDVVVASGKLEPNDTYTLSFSTQQKQLTGLRLEAFASAAAPGGGPGVGQDGSFQLSELKVTADPLMPAAGRKQVKVKLQPGVATFEENGFELAKAVDGNTNTGWSVDGQLGKDHAATFAFENPVGFEGGTKIKVELTFQANQHGLARFRLAATSGMPAAMVDGSAVPQAAREIVSIVEAVRAAGKPLVDDAAVSREAMRWFRKFDTDTDRVLATLDAVDTRQPKPALLSIYGTGKGGSDVYLLKRGEVARKGDKAAAGFVRSTLAADAAEQELFVGTDNKPVAHPRLALAEYITNVNGGAGPLAARVIVNRLWHHHFGRGITATPNDLGTQGEAPTHPELLEWLAGRLVEGNWGLKQIHRLIVTSAVYRQAGTIPESHRVKDPDNLLLWHRRPIRLEGESIRDALLMAAGTLDTKMYGPGTLDVSSPRRSVYLTVKRSQPVPFLQVFDQPEPVLSVGSRGTATVPTQSLAMMNSPFVRTAAEGLAKRARDTIGIGSSPTGIAGDALIDYCFTVVLSRQPKPTELARFTSLLTAREQAAGSDQKKRDLALADVCHLMFCLNEFVYVD